VFNLINEEQTTSICIIMDNIEQLVAYGVLMDSIYGVPRNYLMVKNKRKWDPVCHFDHILFSSGGYAQNAEDRQYDRFYGGYWNKLGLPVNLYEFLALGQILKDVHPDCPTYLCANAEIDTFACKVKKTITMVVNDQIEPRDLFKNTIVRVNNPDENENEETFIQNYSGIHIQYTGNKDYKLSIKRYSKTPLHLPLVARFKLYCYEYAAWIGAGIGLFAWFNSHSA
jgi:hypothetical protein